MGGDTLWQDIAKMCKYTNVGKIFSVLTIPSLINPIRTSLEISKTFYFEAKKTCFGCFEGLRIRSRVLRDI